MSWKDRSEPAESSSWMDRSEPAQDNYWSDTGGNAVKELRSLPTPVNAAIDVSRGVPLQDTAMGKGASSIFKTSYNLMPAQVPISMTQMAQGKPFSETPTGQGVSGLYDAAKTGAQGISNIAKTGARGAMAAPQMLFQNKSLGQTDIGQQFRQRPLGTIGDAAMIAAPIASRFAEGAGATSEATRGLPVSEEAYGRLKPEYAPAEEPKVPNTLEMKGGQHLNSTIGLRPNTVSNLTPEGQNPGIVGNKIIQDLADQDLVGKSYTDTASKILKDTKDAGKAVGAANEAIRTANAHYAAGTSYYDQLKLDANKSLQPILDESNKLLQGDPYSGERVVGKYLKKAYGHLANAANANNGELTLDAVKDEMTRLGKEYTPTNEPMIDQVYGKLANLHDSMVKTVAESAKNPKLRQNLLDANARYSRNMRILPDVLKSAAGEPTSTMRLGTMYENLKDLILHGPNAGKAMIRAGRMFKETPSSSQPSIFKTPEPPASGGPGLFDPLKNEKGSIFPEQEPIKKSEMLTDSERAYKLNELNEQLYLHNNDFENALRAKWGMHKNSGGN